MDSHLTEKLIHACEQVRRCRDVIDSKYLWYWWNQREELLEQVSAQVSA